MMGKRPEIGYTLPLNTFKTEEKIVNLLRKKFCALHPAYGVRDYRIPSHQLILSISTLIILVCMSVLASAQNRIEIYSSALHEELEIDGEAAWEEYRWTLKRNMEEIMGPLPDRQKLPPMKIRVKDSLRTEQYLRLNLEFLAAPGEWVPAYLYIPHRIPTSGKSPAMLALHPTGADGKKIVDGEGKANRAYAKELAERGYVVIAPDYPSFGDLTDYDFHQDRYQSGTMAAIFYHMRSVDLLVDRTDVDPDRIGVIGHSLGGHNSIFVGAFDERLKVVVTSSGWNQMDYYDIGQAAIDRYGGRLGPYAQERYMPLIREKYNLDGDRLPIDYHEMIALLAPRAFFSNSPINDSNFDVKGVEEGIEMVRDVYQFFDAEEFLQVRYPDAEHDFPTKTRREAYEFVDQVLKHTPSEHIME